MNKIIPFGDNLLVKEIEDSAILYAPGAEKLEGIVFASRTEDIKEGDKVYFKKITGRVDDCMVIALEDVIAIQNERN